MAMDYDSSLPSKDLKLSEKFYRAVWRWHFYAGLYVIPFLCMLAVTGLIMLWAGVIDGREGEKAYTVAPAGGAVPISNQADAALFSIPGGVLKQYIGPLGSDGAALFRVDLQGEALMVAVNPYDASVLGSWSRRAGWYDLANDIHGTLLIGDAGDRLIEIAAGLGMVLIVTGLYLWWPRSSTRLADVLIPNLRLSGRPLWKSLHQSIGFYISALLIIFFLSGLSWSGIWGERFIQAWSTFPAEKWDKVPLSDDIHASMNHGAMKDVPWALEQTAMPESGSDAGITGLAPGTPINIDTVVAFGYALGMGDRRFQVNLPQGKEGVWTLSQDSMSNDTTSPTSDRTVHVDQHTGKILADVKYEDYSLGGKAMAVSIAFHEGDMGIWNIALNTIFCLSVIFVSVSGVIMWWMRRPAKAGRLVAPPAPVDMPLWKGAICIGLALCLAFPLVGVALLILLALDVLVLQNIPVLKKAFS
ncbi:PepSY-associated TM helix domain-containing protein [Hahella ganghwensis]|uniref:PepSY-associated TM helix domain-containing protein n=1 Tax=Hahella ganghwensis TaxID=286420 RepID=UPI0003674269|nr:PepSY domain-containing protein [Hahella ganghwensis]